MMTAIIQLFVYPNLWHEHMLWAAALILLVIKGGGMISLDRFITENYINKK